MARKGWNTVFTNSAAGPNTETCKNLSFIRGNYSCADRQKVLEGADQAIAAYQSRLPVQLGDSIVSITQTSYARTDDLVWINIVIVPKSADLIKMFDTSGARNYMRNYLRSSTCKADNNARKVMEYGFRWGYVAYTEAGTKWLEDIMIINDCH